MRVKPVIRCNNNATAEIAASVAVVVKFTLCGSVSSCSMDNIVTYSQ